MDLVLVAIGDHRAPTVPATLADDVEGGDIEGVGGADDRADVEVVLPVLDRDVQREASAVEVGDNRVVPPVTKAVLDVAPVTLAQQLGVEARVLGPRARPGTDAHFSLR